MKPLLSAAKSISTAFKMGVEVGDQFPKQRAVRERVIRVLPDALAVLCAICGKSVDPAPEVEVREGEKRFHLTWRTTPNPSRPI